MENINEDKTEKFDMERFIPSETYRKFLRDNHITLTARQAAKLISRSRRPFEERWEGYRELIRSELTDDELRGKLQTIVRMYSDGSDDDPDTESDAYSDAEDYIENIFADFPLCFKNGDIVHAVNDHRLEGRYGIMHVFPDREERIARLKSMPGMTPDDEELVEFMDEDGEFGHSHMLVTELEKVEWDEIPEHLQLVLECASDLVNGVGTIDALQYAIIEMKNNGRTS